MTNLMHDKVEMYRLLALKGALEMEIVGLQRRGRSVYSIIKDEFDLKGNRRKVLDQFCEIIKRRANENE